MSSKTATTVGRPAKRAAGGRLTMLPSLCFRVCTPMFHSTVVGRFTLTQCLGRVGFHKHKPSFKLEIFCRDLAQKTKPRTKHDSSCTPPKTYSLVVERWTRFQNIHAKKKGHFQMFYLDFVRDMLRLTAFGISLTYDSDHWVDKYSKDQLLSEDANVKHHPWSHPSIDCIGLSIN